MTKPVRIGVLRLVDSAPVIVAAERGLFADLGIEAQVSVEPSWANIADKLAYGLMDAAVMLPPLALASAIGLRGAPAPVTVPMSLTQGGNSIVFGAATGLDRGTSAPHLLEWLRGRPFPPRLAVVHRYSTHNLLLRYWLALAGADPDRDVETVVMPPTEVAQALAEGRISGFCAGAPWGELAERRGVGRIVTGTSSIWPFHPEKCLAVNTNWAIEAPDALHQVIKALLRAQRLCDTRTEADAIAATLADPAWLALPPGPTRLALPGGAGIEQIRFHAGEAWYPAYAHALWFMGQMRRWGWLTTDLDVASIARSVYRPDLLAGAVEEEGLYRAKCIPALEGSALLPMLNDTAITPV